MYSEALLHFFDLAVKLGFPLFHQCWEGVTHFLAAAGWIAILRHIYSVLDQFLKHLIVHVLFQNQRLHPPHVFSVWQALLHQLDWWHLFHGAFLSMRRHLPLYWRRHRLIVSFLSVKCILETFLIYHVRLLHLWRAAPIGVITTLKRQGLIFLKCTRILLILDGFTQESQYFWLINTSNLLRDCSRQLVLRVCGWGSVWISICYGLGHLHWVTCRETIDKW